MREKNIEAKLRNEIKKLGGVAIKFVSPGRRGVTDRLVIVPFANIWFVETKRPGRDLDPLQLSFKKLLIKMGCEHRKVSTTEELQKFLQEVRENILTTKPRIIEGL